MISRVNLLLRSLSSKYWPVVRTLESDPAIPDMQYPVVAADPTKSLCGPGRARVVEQRVLHYRLPSPW